MKVLRFRRHTTEAPGLAVLAAHPLQDLLMTVRKWCAALTEAAPESGEARMVARFEAQLNDAIKQASGLEMFVSTREFAEVMGCTEAAVTRQCRLGRLPAHLFRGRWSINLIEYQRATGTAGHEVA